MGKHHTGRLIDRFVLGERLVIRVQTDRGAVLDVSVPNDEALRAKAAGIWGGGCVRYVYRGGRAVFTGDLNDYPED